MIKKITATIDRIVCKCLARYFLLLDVPESFQKVASNCTKTIVITQSSSIIVRALIRSFAQRREIFSLLRLKDLFNNKEIVKPDTYYLYWESLDEEESLDKIRAELPDSSITTFHIFAGRSPLYATPNYRTKKSTLLKVLFAPLMGRLLGRQIFIFLFGDPFAVVSEKVSAKTKLSRRIKVDIFQNTKLICGVAFQPLDVQKKYVLEGQEAQRMIKLLSKKLNKSEDEIKKDMSEEFNRMATQPDGSHIFLGGGLTKLVMKKFPQIISIGLDNLKQGVKEGALVLVPNHRSHFDYILLNGVIYNSNFRIPLIASGMNLRFWPVGRLLSKAGAFYIRRESKPNLIHNFLLQRYITYLINRGHLQEFFIEGGRTRSGHMLPPKLGLLGIMVNAFLKKVRREVLFMPVSISYEHVAEVGEYAKENLGLPKKRENCIELLKATRYFLFNSHHNGEVIIRFGEPISLAKFSNEIAKEDANGEAFKKKIVSGLGENLIDRITEQYAPCLSNFVYTSLMMAPYYGLTKDELTTTIINLAKYCNMLKKTNPLLGDFSPALTRFINDPEHDLTELTYDKYLSQKDGVFYIPGNQRYCADFYKNSTLHIFYVLGLISILELQNKNITPENVKHLYDLLGQRNIILRQDNIEAEADLIIKALQKENILSYSNNDSENVRYLKKESGFFIPALLLSNLESLLWVYRSYIKQKDKCKNTEPSDESISNHGELCIFNTSELVKQIQSEMLATKYTGPHLRTESSAKSSLNQAIEASKKTEVISADSFSQGKTISLIKEPKEEIEELKSLITAIRNYLQEKGDN